MTSCLEKTKNKIKLRPKLQMPRGQCHEINKEVRLKNEYAFVRNFLKV
jgi:hypothetical protein